MLATDLWLNVTPSAGSAVEQGIAPQVSLLSSGITCGHPLARPLDGPQADRRALMIAYARRVGGVPVLFALRSVAVNRG
jgi:hypothetical protein